jgi:hypothetical protein
LTAASCLLKGGDEAVGKNKLDKATKLMLVAEGRQQLADRVSSCER